MKKCCFDGCTNNVFGGGYCLIHQYKRNKAQNKPIKPRSIKKNTNVPQKQNNGFKSQLQYSFGFTTQKQMFDFIWETREHKCALSDRNLDKIQQWQWHWMFSHILNKKNYPFFKLKEDNILLLHPAVHTMVDNFTEDLRQKNKEVNFDLWFEFVEQKKEEYKKFLLDNML